MRKSTLLIYFKKHCLSARSKLIKKKMIEGLKEGLCPFRCRYCKKRGKDCSDCPVLEIKETIQFQECQSLIKESPSLLKEFIPILKKIVWKNPNLRGGF